MVKDWNQRNYIQCIKEDKRYDLIQLFKIVHGYEESNLIIFFNSMLAAQEDNYSKKLNQDVRKH